MKKSNEQKKEIVSLISCFATQQQQLMTCGRPFTASNYGKVMQSVRRFLGEQAATFGVDDVSGNWLVKYVMYMQDVCNLSKGSSDCYLRVVRAVYNRAISEGVAEKKEINPFEGISITVPTTEKRTLDISEIKTLIRVNLSKKKELELVRDLFVFMFFARGMCFVDLFNLSYNEVSGGHIKYQRSKTKARLCVNIEPEMQVVMDRYREEGNPYVFPFLRRHCYDKAKEVSEQTAMRRTNRQLNKLGRFLDFPQPLTSYVARHTWASSAEASEMSISLISQALGHGSERITRTYMKGIPSHIMDSASKKMFDTLIRKEDIETCPALCKNKTFTCCTPK